MFKFNEGAPATLKNDNPVLGLVAGDIGTIWALYDTQPPAYEVTFRTQNGEEFDALMYEDELTDPTIAVEAADRRPKPALVSALTGLGLDYGNDAGTS